MMFLRHFLKMFTFHPYVEFLSVFNIKTGVTFIYVKCVSHTYSHIPFCISVVYLSLLVDIRNCVCVRESEGERGLREERGRERERRRAERMKEKRSWAEANNLQEDKIQYCKVWIPSV